MIPTSPTWIEGRRGPVTSGTPVEARKFRDLLTLAYLEHRAILTLCTLYMATGGVLLRILHRPWPISVGNRFFLIIWLTSSTLWLLWQWVHSPRRLRRAMKIPRICGAILVGLIAVPTQITFQALKQSISADIGFHSDRMLYEASVRIHGRMAWQWLAPVLDHPDLVHILDLTYMLWFPAILGFTLWCSWTRDRVLRQRAIVAFLLMWVIAGTLFAAAFSSAGPIYYGKVVAGPDPYAPLVRRLDAISTNGMTLFNRVSERNLWTTYRHDTWSAFGGISAMPSLHVGIATLYVLIAWRRSRRLAAFLGAFAAVIQIGSVVLGWHYPVDGYAGAALAGVCWWAAGRLQAPNEVAAALAMQTIIDETI